MNITMEWVQRFLHTKEDDLNDRPRQFAFTVCLVGTPIMLISIVSISLLGESSFYLIVSSGIAILTWLVVGVSSYFKFALKYALPAGLLITFANVWGISCWEILTGELKQHHLALLLFIPALAVSLLHHKIILLLIPLQCLLVFFVSVEYATQYFSVEFSENNIVIIGVLFAVMSGSSTSVAALTARIRDKNDQRLLRVIEEKNALSMTDPLTGLQNRRALMAVLDKSQRTERQIVLAFADLDRFKPINDEIGHAAGDFVLKEIAARLSASPHIQVAARIGGDEFALILDTAQNETDIDQVIAHIHGLITEAIETDTGALNVGVSIGYVNSEEDIESASLLLPAAEVAMRRAKQNYLGWARFDHKFDDATMATNSLETAFESALRKGHIRPALQPIRCSRTRSIVGHELLARWVTPALYEQPRPDQFIPIAEKLGLLNEVLCLTLDEALASPDAHLGTLSVNVSPAQVTSSDFLSKIIDILNRHSFPPERLILEITEAVAFRNLDQNIRVLNSARRLGIKIALDDFGTGFSSLMIIEKLPLDKLKIDKSLVKNLSETPKAQTILDVVLQMANKLSLVSCVEGVEDEVTANYVTRLGADEIQGFWLGHPKLVSDSHLTKSVA